jgi:hypothetical protein
VTTAAILKKCFGIESFACFMPTSGPSTLVAAGAPFVLPRVQPETTVLFTDDLDFPLWSILHERVIIAVSPSLDEQLNGFFC